MSFENEGQETNRDGNLSQITRVPGDSQTNTTMFQILPRDPVQGTKHQGQVMQAICRAAVRSLQIINESPPRTLAGKA